MKIQWIIWGLILFGLLLGLAFVASPFYLWEHGGLVGWGFGLFTPRRPDDWLTPITGSLGSVVLGLLLLVGSVIASFVMGLTMTALVRGQEKKVLDQAERGKPE